MYLLVVNLDANYSKAYLYNNMSLNCEERSYTRKVDESSTHMVPSLYNKLIIFVFYS